MAPYHFSTGFNKYWYQKHLPDNGFKIQELTANGNFFEYVAQENWHIRSVSSRYTNCRPNIFELMAIFIIQRML
jgi:hypothetical protein